MMRAAALSVLVLMLGFPRAALAQKTHEMDAHFFRPALFSGGIFALDRAAKPTQYQPGFGFYFNYASSPLRMTFPQEQLRPGAFELGEQEILESTMAFNLQAQFAFTSWLELALDLPVARHSYVTNPAEDVDEGYEALSAGDLTTTLPTTEVAPLDLRVGLKLAFLERAGFSLALGLIGTLPFGDEEILAGDKGFSFQPRLLAGFDRGSLGVVANVGYTIRERHVILWDDPETKIAKAVPLLGIDDELSFGVGAAYQFHRYIGVGAELIGAVPLSLGSYDVVARETKLDAKGVPYEEVTEETVDLPGSTVMEVLGGLIFAPLEGLNVAVGGGVGVTGDERKVGWRTFVGFSWLPGVKAPLIGAWDRDKDGVADAKDACPDKPEDKDGFQDEDGCPEADNDQDGVADASDRCPVEAEDKDGFQDEDGCPDPDNDGDGVPDTKDTCPDKAEDKDGFQDEDGCPEADNDGDNIADADDRCPNEPETVNNYQDDDGCPDSVPTKVTVGKGAITIPEQIQFKRGSAVIEKKSYPLLDEIAKKVRENPQVGRIRIEGHCDKSGTPDANQRLSQARAESVRRYLIGKGVRPTRLQAVGYGFSRPVAPNTTPEGRIKNRRVEFVIIKEQKKGP
jgi:outer membrane protein OmpA-like peptidoglycan-associated protein